MVERGKPSQGVPYDLMLGQVRSALRPKGIDPVEVREVLLVAHSLGFDPSDLYLQAVRGRPPGYERAPSLMKVLPASLRESAEDEPDPEPEGEPESASPAPASPEI